MHALTEQMLSTTRTALHSIAPDSPPPPLRRCLRLNRECAALCHATLDVRARSFEADTAIICVARAADCDEHQMHEHCEACAECLLTAPRRGRVARGA